MGVGGVKWECERLSGMDLLRQRDIDRVQGYKEFNYLKYKVGITYD